MCSGISIGDSFSVPCLGAAVMAVAIFPWRFAKYDRSTELSFQLWFLNCYRQICEACYFMNEYFSMITESSGTRCVCTRGVKLKKNCRDSFLLFRQACA